MTVASTRMTIGTLLGTVNDAAGAVGSVFNTATKSVGMLDKLVSDAAERQSIRSVVDMNDFTTKLAEEKAMEETMRKKTIMEFTAQSQTNADLYKASYDRITALIEARNK